MSIKSALRTIGLFVTASSDEKSQHVRKSAIDALARPPFVPSAPPTLKLWSLKEQEEFYKHNPAFATNLHVVSDGKETDFEVIVDGIDCTYCGEHVDAEEIHALGDTDMCEACYQGMVE